MCTSHGDDDGDGPPAGVDVACGPLARRARARARRRTACTVTVYSVLIFVSSSHLTTVASRSPVHVRAPRIHTPLDV